MVASKVPNSSRNSSDSWPCSSANTGKDVELMDWGISD